MSAAVKLLVTDPTANPVCGVTRVRRVGKPKSTLDRWGRTLLPATSFPSSFLPVRGQSGVAGAKTPHRIRWLSVPDRAPRVTITATS